VRPVRLKPDTTYEQPDTTYEQRQVRLKPDATHEHVAQHVAAVELASLDLSSHISSKAPVLVARHFDHRLVAQ
jgi:hypothetical protein